MKPAMLSSGGRTLCLLLVALSALLAVASAGGNGIVTYDGRSLLINGRRELLFSGSIHYPRSTPEMWGDIIAKSKQGGLNTIQTYVFWNIHEPQPGQYNFEGNYDLVKFIKLIQKHGMYVTLRIGPFIEAEWNYGGFPYWLKEVPDIIFRTDNAPFKYYMKRFTKKIVEMMKDEKLYASQGGPIILSQIENEYNNVAAAFKEGGSSYVKWAGSMAVGLGTGVPWLMCKQRDAPGPVISACNGRNCGDTFKTEDQQQNKPLLWTENWTAQYRVFGDPPSQRAAEDLAYSVARFFSKGGTLTNYYMYHGGTNFGRTGSSFVTTRYYDEAPLDEFGLPKEPKWGHLRDLHAALKLCRKALLWGNPTLLPLGKGLEARVFENSESGVCAAFLSNNNSRIDASVNFRGTEYFLPRHSISILPDCKTVVFNTQRVNAQHNSRTFQVSKEANKNSEWQAFQETLPKINSAPIKSKEPLELMNLTKDTTDYVWYTTSFKLESDDLPRRRDIIPVIVVSSLGHAVHVFVNDVYIGSGHGTNIEKSFVFQKPTQLRPGDNHIALLSMTVGLPDSGAYLEHRIAGVHSLVIQGLNTGTLDLTENVWGHEIGVLGEKLQLHTEEGAKKVQWTSLKSDTPVTWYKRYFDAPHGDDPVAIEMTNMGKGMVWVNGMSAGRYWVSYLSPLGKPSQSTYHIPRSILKPTGNLIVIFEESGGKPEDTKIMTVRRDNICTFISEFHPAGIRSWVREDSRIRAVGGDLKPQAHLECTNHKVIQSVVFASYGNPTGMCGEFMIGTCHSPATKAIVEKACIGKASCVLPVSHEAYQSNPQCPGTTSTLAIQAKCVKKKD